MTRRRETAVHFTSAYPPTTFPERREAVSETPKPDQWDAKAAELLICPKCAGSGVRPVDEDEEECPRCAGTGYNIHPGLELAVAAALREMWEQGQKEERVCVWDNGHTTCGKTDNIAEPHILIAGGMPFCPFCGGRIEVTP